MDPLTPTEKKFLALALTLAIANDARQNNSIEAYHTAAGIAGKLNMYTLFNTIFFEFIKTLETLSHTLWRTAPGPNREATDSPPASG